MTNEERHIAVLNRMLESMDVYDSIQPTTERKKAIKAAIKALEQQPCEDVISREAVIEWLKAKDIIKLSSQEETARKELKALPPVTPQQKYGEWIPVSERLPEKYTYTLWCASSRYVRSDYFNGEFWEDAKKLGYEVIAWMPLPKPYEPQESEE